MEYNINYINIESGFMTLTWISTSKMGSVDSICYSLHLKVISPRCLVRLKWQIYPRDMISLNYLYIIHLVVIEIFRFNCGLKFLFSICWIIRMHFSIFQLEDYANALTKNYISTGIYTNAFALHCDTAMSLWHNRIWFEFPIDSNFTSSF